MSETNPTENKKAVKPKRKRGRMLKRIKKLIKLLLLLVILVVAALFGLKAYIAKQAADSADQPNILAETEGTLTELRVSIGDEVKQGDVIAVISNEELDDTITDYEFQLWELDDTITGTMNSSVTNIKSPVKGRVMAIYAQKGDDALAVFRREGALAIISTDGRMKVELSDVPTNMGIELGQSLRVRGDTVDEYGTVTDLTMQGTHVVVTVIGDNFPMGEAVQVTTADGDVVGEGTLEVNKPMAVSSYGGTIKSVAIKVGQTVARKDVIFTLEDSPLSLTLENLRLQREAAAKNLSEAKEQRENLIVLAPCDGVVASLNVSEGDKIESGTLIGSILQGEDMTLTIAVDELDVVEVEIGQKVTITIDALSDAELAGEVYKIAPVGTNSGGVTTYDVELAFEAAGTGVRSGMNATGEIEIASTDSTIYVPVEAIMTINNTTYVMVEDGGSMTLATAASTQTSNSQRGNRGDRSQMGDMAQMGDMPQRGDGEMPDMSQMGDMPQMGDGETPDMSSMPQMSADASNAETEQTKVSFFTRAMAKVMAWLYDGVDLSASTVTGSLVQVEVGMQNDDYAEILSGVTEGQIVLYTGDSDTDTTSFMMGGMGGGSNRGGNMGGGMGGGMMGF